MFLNMLACYSNAVSCGTKSWEKVGTDLGLGSERQSEGFAGLWLSLMIYIIIFRPVLLMVAVA